MIASLWRDDVNSRGRRRRGQDRDGTTEFTAPSVFHLSQK
jgi:hypothetical protein